LKKAGIKNIRLRLSHAGLVRALLEKFGLSEEEQAKAFDDILDGDEKVLARMKAEKPELSRILTPLLDMKGQSSGFLKNVKALFNNDFPELEQSLDNFVNVVEMLEEMGINYRIDIASGRGFEYYTGIIYQLLAGGQHIGGGGRYDALIPLMGGSDVPASGFALYLDRMMDIIKQEGISGSDSKKILVKAEHAQIKEAFKLVSSLHDEGYVAEIHTGDKEPEGGDWLIEVPGEEPHFVVKQITSQEKFEVSSKNEVLKILASGN
jgi:histidyl-tRNA synthetase